MGYSHKYSIFKLLIFFLLALLLLSGCVEYQAAISVAQSESRIENSDFLTYCAKENSEDNQIYFCYPQIDASKENAEKINTLIVNYVKSVLQNYIWQGFNGNIIDSPEEWEWNNDAYSIQAMDVDYTVILTDAEYLSVVFEGLYNHKNAAHPIHYFSSLVIDINNCKMFALSDIYEINSDFINLIEYKYKEQIRTGLAGKAGISADDIPKSVENVFANYDDARLIEIFSEPANSDNSGLNYFLNNTELVISVPLTYALGDHYEFSIEYAEIIDYLK